MRADITHPDVAPLDESALIGDVEWNKAHNVTLPTHALGSLGSAVTIDLANGTLQTGTVTENVTITLPAIPADTTESLTLILTNAAAAGPFAITVASAAGFAWLHGEAPTLNDAATERNLLVFRGAAGEGWIGDGGSA